MSRLTRIPSLLCAALLLCLGACDGDPPDGDGGPGADGGDAGPLGPAPREPEAPAEGAVCVLDIDCEADKFCFLGFCSTQCDSDEACPGFETCSPRGRCVGASSTSVPLSPLDGEEEAATPERVDDARIVSAPELSQFVDPGLDAITVSATAEGPLPEAGVPYRIETTSPEGADVVYRAEVEGDQVRFTVPTGEANPSAEEPTRVQVNIVSALGSFRLDLLPRLPVAGEYAGEARVDRLGNMSIPLRFMVVTQPEGASLETASAAYLLLPIGDEELLSPREAFDDAEWQARPLEYDGFVRAWVARFDNELRLGEGSLLGERPVGQVGRTLRFEIAPRDGGGLVGTFTDRWTGLYEERSEAGVLEPAVVSYGATFEAGRFGAALAPGEVTVAPLDGPAPGRLPAPPLDACTDAMFAIGPITVDSVEYGCDTIDTVGEFGAAAPETRAACAIAVAETALAGDTTVGLITDFLDGDGTTPGGESFADFMERCAAGTDGTCRPSLETLCGRQLTAFAYVAQTDDVSSAAQLVESFEDTTREAFLGRQLGAFQTDSNLRLEWLRTTDYPAIVTSAVEDLNAALLDEWVAGVLDVHAEVLEGQFDASGLAVLAREASTPDTIERRRTLLFDLTQGWRAAMESLVLATQRWNSLLRDRAARADRVAFVSARTIDLYVLAGIAGNLNLSAGSGFANAAFAGGFGALRRQLRQLELPFSELAYARDAEVVVSTSLDPESNNNTVLRDARENATTEIGDAQDAVGAILAEAQARALSEAQLRNQLTNDLDEARGALVELCGLPVGCAVGDFPDESECAVRIEAGACGFAIDRFTGELRAYAGQPVTTSSAGRTMLAVLDAANSYNVVEAEASAHFARSARAFQDAEAFALQVERWNERRQSNLGEIQQIIDQRSGEWDEALRELVDNVGQRQRLRQDAIDEARAVQDQWEQVEAAGRQESMRSRLRITALEAVSRQLGRNADLAVASANAAKEGLPRIVGVSSADPFSAARAAILMSGIAASTALRAASDFTQSSADLLQISADAAAAENAVRVRDIQQEGEFDQRALQAEIDALRDANEVLRIREGARDAEANRLIAALERAMEVELAYERDQVELLDRRTAAWGLLQDNATMVLRILQSSLGIDQRVFEYLEIVQRAELLQSRINELESQQQNVNLLLGSPAVVFSWANRLQQAELRLERAKSALMDWLVAMEYFAVRPFMDLRIQILLARNPYQLEAIAAEMRRLEAACGGPQSELSSEVGVASLLGVSDGIVDPETMETFTPGERLRAVFTRGAVPIDTRTRYSSGETIGDLLNRGAVWSATVSLDLNRFANLASTCNAKIVSFDVALVGEDLGDARPTVTILYDGTSQLRSCQPGISDYVEQFGPEATSFNEITTFRTPSRSVSPVAGINAFPSDTGGTGNLSLAGLPLASQYTLLIDRTAGENAQIDWGNLEDIRLRVNYAYQDVFPVGQCE